MREANQSEFRIDDFIFGDPRYFDLCSELGAVYYCPKCEMDEAAMFFEDTKGLLFFICSCGHKGYFRSNISRGTVPVWDKYFH